MILLCCCCCLWLQELFLSLTTTLVVYSDFYLLSFVIILVLLSKFKFNDTSLLLLLLSSWLPKLVCKFKFLPAISCSLSGEMLSIHKNGSVCKTQVLRLSLHKCQSKMLCNNICYISIYSDYFKGNPLKLFQSYESNFQFNTEVHSL